MSEFGRESAFDYLRNMAGHVMNIWSVAIGEIGANENDVEQTESHGRGGVYGIGLNPSLDSLLATTLQHPN